MIEDLVADGADLAVTPDFQAAALAPDGDLMRRR